MVHGAEAPGGGDETQVRRVDAAGRPRADAEADSDGQHAPRTGDFRPRSRSHTKTVRPQEHSSELPGAVERRKSGGGTSIPSR